MSPHRWVSECRDSLYVQVCGKVREQEMACFSQREGWHTTLRGEGTDADSCCRGGSGGEGRPARPSLLPTYTRRFLPSVWPAHVCAIDTGSSQSIVWIVNRAASVEMLF